MVKLASTIGRKTKGCPGRKNIVSGALKLKIKSG